jgi:hypothetical protein
MRAFLFVTALIVLGVWFWSLGYSQGWRDGVKR